jgi:hypothetical protein
MLKGQKAQARCLMMKATVDVEPRSLGGQAGCDAEVASKCRRGVISLWKHGLMVFGSENPKVRIQKSERGGSKPCAS